MSYIQARINRDESAGIGELIDFVGPSIDGMRKLLNMSDPD